MNEQPPTQVADLFGLFTKTKAETPPAIVADETRASSLAYPDPDLYALFGVIPSAAGVSVSPASALRVPAVSAGVKALSEAAGGLPLHAYRKAADGARERDAGHAATRLLNADANPWTRGQQLREIITADAIAFGNGFAAILRDADGEPRELHRLNPQSVTIEIDDRTNEPRYRVNPPASERIIAYHDILHIRAPSPTSSDLVGVSPLMQAKDAIGLLIVLQQHANALFANGGRPSGILSFADKLGADVAARIKASWQSATSGVNAGKTAVLEQGGKFQPLSFSSVDAQFVELWALGLTEIARVLRVPPVLLMDYSRQTWANAEVGGQQFLTYSLAPWLARWEAEATLKLIPADDRDAVFVEHLTDSLLRSDFATRATAYGQYRAMGVMTANEVRAGLNLPPIAGGDTLDNPHITPGAADAPA